MGDFARFLRSLPIERNVQADTCTVATLNLRITCFLLMHAGMYSSSARLSVIQARAVRTKHALRSGRFSTGVSFADVVVQTAQQTLSWRERRSIKTNLGHGM